MSNKRKIMILFWAVVAFVVFNSADINLAQGFGGGRGRGGGGGRSGGKAGGSAGGVAGESGQGAAQSSGAQMSTQQAEGEEVRSRSRSGFRGSRGGLFGRLDTDEDGLISQEEFTDRAEDRAAGMIDRLDTDEDGLVSADEFRGPEDRFDDLDANDDGQISEDELNAGMEANLTAMFNELDANDDGFISEDERPQGPSFGDEAGDDAAGEE